MTNVNVVPPCIDSGSRGWWLSTKTGTRRALAPPARPRLVPWPVAAAEHLAAHDVGADVLDDLVDDLRVGGALAASNPCCSRQLSVANTHSCRRIPPSPIGFSRLWLGPATKPSSEIEMWQVTELMPLGLPPASEIIAHHARRSLRPDDYERDTQRGWRVSPSAVESMQSGPDVAVRRAQPADAETIAQLLHDFNTEFDEYSPGAAALSDRVRQLLATGETTVLLGGAAPDGLAVLRFRPDIWTESLECYVAELYVVPSRRGQGLGRALMEAAIEFARQEGAEHMDLGTSEDDIAARCLYESLGFTNREGKPDGPINYFYEREL